ncbi:MAG: DUF2877 domain-containing protein [Opitutaceae bacterium]|jgi:hypothetical protein|nr:DUF2877 domain-containing protein [Opitutaceae bacterium]
MMVADERLVLRVSEMSRLAGASVARMGAGRVHSVFRRCFNITGQSGDWLTVAVAPFPRTPDGVIVETRENGPDFSPWSGVEAGMAVVLAPGEIWIPDAGLALALADAKIFDTRREPFARTVRNDGRAARNLALAREVIRRRGRVCDAPEFHRRAAPALAALREGILANDAATMRAQCEALLGLGVGLTPSGDDILGGIAAGLFLGGAAGDKNRFLPVLRQLLRDDGRTTDVSARSLRLCANGEINAVVFETARAILCEGKVETEREVSVLLKQGGTSGTETAQGLCLGLQLAGETGETTI